MPMQNKNDYIAESISVVVWNSVLKSSMLLCNLFITHIVLSRGINNRNDRNVEWFDGRADDAF